MKKYIPYLLKFAFMIFAIFPAIKHEWLAISTGVISLAIKTQVFSLLDESTSSSPFS